MLQSIHKASQNSTISQMPEARHAQNVLKAFIYYSPQACPKHALSMPKACPKNVLICSNHIPEHALSMPRAACLNIPRACPEHAQSMPRACPKHAQSMPKACPELE